MNGAFLTRVARFFLAGAATATSAIVVLAMLGVLVACISDGTRTAIPDLDEWRILNPCGALLLGWCGYCYVCHCGPRHVRCPCRMHQRRHQDSHSRSGDLSSRTLTPPC